MLIINKWFKLEINFSLTKYHWQQKWVSKFIDAVMAGCKRDVQISYGYDWDDGCWCIECNPRLDGEDMDCFIGTLMQKMLFDKKIYNFCFG